MAYKTKLQVVSKIEMDLDLQEEDFIQDDEMTSYINDGITIIEAHINKLGLKDKYLRTRTSLSLVQGTADYSLPTNLYENKIIEVVYSNGSSIYGMRPITGVSSAEEIELINQSGTSDLYGYRIRNDASDENYFQLIPAARTTESNTIVIEYYRDLERVSADADLVEVPEIALQYLYQYVKVMIYEKETHANYGSAVAKLEKLEALMLSTLEGQLADDKDSGIEADFSFYEDAN